MRDTPPKFSLPRWRLTRWLGDAGRDVPEDIRVALIGSLFGTLPIFIGGMANTIAVSALIAWRIPQTPFLIWFGLELAIGLSRALVLVTARRAAVAGRPTPTDWILLLSVLWPASLGYGCFISLTSGDWLVAALACMSAAGMVGGICFRSFAVPRLVGFMIALTLTPICAGALLVREPIFLITLCQLPFYIHAMTSAAYRLNRVMVATMQAERKNGFLARHDALTGLLNRAGLDVAMAKLASSPANTIGLLFLDLDGFKAVNDAMGHEAGDRLLAMVGERFGALVGPDDVAARIGGDEFVLLCSGRSRGALVALAERLISEVSAPYPGLSGPTVVGASVGIAMSPDHGSDLTSLLSAADDALYRAKFLGKGRCALASRKTRELAGAPIERMTA